MRARPSAPGSVADHWIWCAEPVRDEQLVEAGNERLAAGLEVAGELRESPARRRSRPCRARSSPRYSRAPLRNRTRKRTLALGRSASLAIHLKPVNVARNAALLRDTRQQLRRHHGRDHQLRAMRGSAARADDARATRRSRSREHRYSRSTRREPRHRVDPRRDRSLPPGPRNLTASARTRSSAPGSSGFGNSTSETPSGSACSFTLKNCAKPRRANARRTNFSPTPCIAGYATTSALAGALRATRDRSRRGMRRRYVDPSKTARGACATFEDVRGMSIARGDDAILAAIRTQRRGMICAPFSQ